MKATAIETPSRRQPAREIAKILDDCRDLAITRLTTAFSQILDKVGDMLMDRASRSDVREDQQLFLDARGTLKGERPALMAEFEAQLRTLIDERIAGKASVNEEFSKADTRNLALVETTSMDESVLNGNITRVVENACHEELLVLNRGMGHLLGKPDLSTDANPLSPSTIVDAFAHAVQSLKAERRIKFQIMKDLNQAQLGGIATIYADVNAHLTRLNLVPAISRPATVNRGGSADRAAERAAAKAAKEHAPPPEMDVMSLFKRMYGSGTPMAAPRQSASGPGMHAQGSEQGGGGHAPMGYAPMGADGDLPTIAMPGMAQQRSFGPMPTTPSGYAPGAPIITSADLHEGLTRLQAGQSGFDVGGATVSFSGIPDGLHNVLRDLQESPLGAKANQIESMTIEMVAMLFDFIFETRDLTDGIKAQLARLQIPVLKAAMLDGAFFAKKTHPSRLLVNALADAGLGWSPEMGNSDPLYRTIEHLVRRILNEFSDNLALFDELREELETFLADEEKAAEDNIATSADEINQNDKLQIAVVIGKAEIERRIENYPIPQFLATFLREHWQSTLEHVYLKDGDESESWTSAVTTLEDLVWSVQPKRSGEDRKHLVALLPSLLKRLGAGVHNQRWTPDQRERFMTNLVEAHAAAVKPSFAAATSPTAAVAEAAKAQAEVAKASGDSVAAAKAEALAAAMAPAMPAPPEAPMEVLDDEYLEIARNLERGMWVEFESEGGQLAFAKLAWVSPLRGTYLFTNRQGQKALSMTAEDLAHRFRADRARLVEAEPLVDRAMTSVITNLTQKIAEPADAM
ncbi:MAG: DUF1631 domain-containing protein [Betaproteobacteria bacterium]